MNWSVRCVVEKCDSWYCTCKINVKLITYVQDWTQVLFNQYFIFGTVIWHFHITSYLTELSVFLSLFTNEETLWCVSWGMWIPLAFNPRHTRGSLKNTEEVKSLSSSVCCMVCFRAAAVIQIWTIIIPISGQLPRLQQPYFQSSVNRLFGSIL